jgi:hypothetical protein
MISTVLRTHTVSPWRARGGASRAGARRSRGGLRQGRHPKKAQQLPWLKIYAHELWTDPIIIFAA